MYTKLNNLRFIVLDNPEDKWTNTSLYPKDSGKPPWVLSHYFPHDFFMEGFFRVLNEKTQGINLQKVQNMN